ncbi:O-antigen ligase family protein [uncultured Adlercreutzia sp.]|uniref:O-antigen ligase family protein n=1 Tax=uncultured Adlercreutzia sp. TaxID=875803 RepID=UPI0026F3FFF2|nr:O-antigen ligase family protein [uncultured Adlercreutzia sp.]MCI9261494.1 hypothetical protein [Eggerthellaceae bacterium]
MSFGSGIAMLGAVIVAALALAQGGFYPTPVIVAGAVSLAGVAAAIFVNRAAARAQGGSLRRWALSGAFIAIALLNAASAVAHGWPSEATGVVLCWVALAAFALFCGSVPLPEKATALEGLCWFVAVTAVFGLLAVAGLLPAGGTMAAGRLCLLFEYSNATGIWFGLGVLLMSAADNSRIRALAPLGLVALFATQSVGAVAVTGLALTVAAVVFMRMGRFAEAESLALSWIAALVSFALQLVFPAAGLVGALATTVGLWVWGEKLQDGHQVGDRAKQRRKGAASKERKATEKQQDAKARRDAQERQGVSTQEGARRPRALVCIVVAAIVTVGAAAAVLLLEPARWVEAQGTFAERFVMMQDGLALLAASPLLGVGPEQWAQLYPGIQTVEYTAAVNHCSYLQLALDGGVFVPILYVGAMGAAVVNCARRGHWPWALAVATLLVHSVFDFDLHFFALQFLAVLLVSEASECEALRSGQSRQSVRL